MVLLYWGCAADVPDLRWKSCRFQVCELFGAGTPRGALFRPILGLQGPSGLTKVTQVAPGSVFLSKSKNEGATRHPQPFNHLGKKKGKMI